MEGLTIVETKTLQSLISKVEVLQDAVLTSISELKDATKPYLSTQDLMDMTGFSSKWVLENKSDIGFTTVGNQLRFKRKDVEEFIERNYFKVQKKKNQY